MAPRNESARRGSPTLWAVSERSESATTLLAFFGLACGITWACALPATMAWAKGAAPSEGAMGLAGLSAWGPTIAAVVVASRSKQIRSVFGPWRVPPIWLVAGLAVPLAIQQLARVVAHAIGLDPGAWLNPPIAPEHWAALVMFSVGEEFGWRGYAQPRMVRRFGLVRGSMLVGLGWAVWHAMFLISPETGRFDAQNATLMLMLPGFSVVLGWLWARGGGSVAIAIAFHAAGHVDNLNRMNPGLDLRIVVVVVVTVVAVVVAGWVGRDRQSTGE